MKRLLSSVPALTLACSLTAPLAAQSAPLETCRRAALNRYATDRPTVVVTSAGLDHQNNQVFRWTATWTSGKASGSCLVNAQGQVSRFDVVSTSSTGGPAVQPPVRPVKPVQPVQPAPVTPATRVTCESKESRRNECAIPLNYRARLVRTISTSPCVENRSWGTTERVLWVTAGCRGEFELSGRPTTPVGPGYGTRRITCGSPVGNQVECKTHGYATNVRLVRELTGNRCRQNSNWGYTDSFIWTNGGCRAEFEVSLRGTGPNKPVPGGGANRTVTCGNSYGAQMSCNLFGQASTVRVSRDLSNGRCRQGSTWGFNNQDMWVKGGCYADFLVTYGRPIPR